MPPKSRIEREEILNRAFELARREGFESLTARGLAASLGCSTQPIYDAFADRKALEAAAAGRAFAFMLRRMRENPEPDVPPGRRPPRWGISASRWRKGTCFA